MPWISAASSWPSCSIPCTFSSTTGASRNDLYVTLTSDSRDRFGIGGVSRCRHRKASVRLELHVQLTLSGFKRLCSLRAHADRVRLRQGGTETATWVGGLQTII
eukprot:3416417-Rhodomonas_salina.5